MKIFIAVTAYNHQVYGECSESLLKNCVTLMQAGHTVIPYYNNDLYIDRSRNLCAHVFLETDCSDLVFVDADLAFDDDAILKLLAHDREIVAGAYPYKKAREEYSVTLRFNDQMNCKDEDTGLVSCDRVPAGLMRVQRQVFDRIKEGLSPDERGIYPFFQTGMICGDGKWYGEDAFFCKRWRDMGGEIWLEPRINFTHYGTQGFSGNYHEYLMGRRVDKLDEVESGIPGWMSDRELTLLRELASKSDSVVEIGSWKGRSTQALLESCKGKVYAVDHWQGSPDQATSIAPELIDIYQEFINNVGHYPNLAIMKGDSLDIAENFNGEKVDMVFIDGGHEYEEVYSDIEAWLPKCKKVISGHDYGVFDGVTQAVDEKFSDRAKIAGTIWYVEV